MAKKITIILLVLFGLVGTANADRKKYDKLSEAKYSPACLTDLNPQFENSNDNAAQGRIIVGKDNDCELGVGKSSKYFAHYSLMGFGGWDMSRKAETGVYKYFGGGGHVAGGYQVSDGVGLFVQLGLDASPLMGDGSSYLVIDQSGSPDTVYSFRGNTGNLKPGIGLSLMAESVTATVAAGVQLALSGNHYNGIWIDVTVEGGVKFVTLRGETSYESLATVDNYGHRGTVCLGKVNAACGGLMAELNIGNEKYRDAQRFLGIYAVGELTLGAPSWKLFGGLGTTEASPLTFFMGVSGAIGGRKLPSK